MTEGAIMSLMHMTVGFKYAVMCGWEIDLEIN